MIPLTQFDNLPLRGGFIISRVRRSQEPLVDALGREAVAETRVTGQRFELVLSAGQSDEELSVSLYHEILEAAAVACHDPPASVINFNEGDFEQAAQLMHTTLGEASPDNLDRMLQHFGFS